MAGIVVQCYRSVETGLLWIDFDWFSQCTLFRVCLGSKVSICNSSLLLGVMFLVGSNSPPSLQGTFGVKSDCF